MMQWNRLLVQILFALSFFVITALGCQLAVPLAAAPQLALPQVSVPQLQPVGSPQLALSQSPSSQPSYVWSPSLANFGWHPCGPLLLGQGFGSEVYHDLSRLWDKVQDSQFDAEQMDCGKRLAKVLADFRSDSESEEMLSTCVAAVYQELIPKFYDEGQQKMYPIHRAEVGGKSRCNMDIALLHDFKVHAVNEVKHCQCLTLFPEAEATSYGAFLKDCNHWLPVFVLSKDHVQIGVADGAMLHRWVYSDIFSYSVEGGFEPGNNDHVHVLLKSVKFFVQAAWSHQKYNKSLKSAILDADGQTVIEELSILGERVLYGKATDGSQKVFKFYASGDEADRALNKQKTVSAAIPQTFVAKACKGYGKNAVGAVLDDYIVSNRQVSAQHLQSLTQAIQCLSEKNLLHGDLREPNIIYKTDGEVALIDCDWSGEKGTAFFPWNVNSRAFGAHAQFYIIPNQPIRSNFDFICLADILAKHGCSSATIQHAVDGHPARVLQGLSTSAPRDLQQTLWHMPVFRLNCMGQHIAAYYRTLDSSDSSTTFKVNPKRGRRSSTVASENDKRKLVALLLKALAPGSSQS